METSLVQPKLTGFDDYQEFLSFSKSLFQLKMEEYQGLFDVLVKLQSIGQDAIQTMLVLKSNTDEQDCYELIRFMIQFDSMDMGDIKTMLSSWNLSAADPFSTKKPRIIERIIKCLIGSKKEQFLNHTQGNCLYFWKRATENTNDIQKKR